MSLKKSDKIIALIGVLIIVVAGIAIVYFAINQKKSEPTGPTTTTYNVIWTEDSGQMKLTGLNVQKGEPFTKPFNVIADEKPGSILTSVSIKISWKDHNTFGLKGTKGLDILKVTITPEGEKTSKPYEGTGSGENETIGSFSINTIPDIREVKAATYDEAQDSVYNNCTGKDSASFNLDASIEIGEPAWRLFKAKKDTGNDFSLIITYTYYYPEIENPE